ncbi:MAG: response regulator, partial [Thermoproteota archaeon]|nr:response regulator [Thermoproteota archaeon]
ITYTKMSADNSNSTATSTITNNINNMNSNRLKRILIVDDEQDIISVFRMVLEMNDFEVDAYNDPLLALSNFKQNAYDLVILDIRMPVINGFELYKKIRKVDDKVKVCFMTAFDDYRQEFKKSFPMLDEIKCFIRKPKAVEDLVNHVATILG